MELVIRKVRTRRERMDFIQLPFVIYKGDSAWVPPLIGEMKKTLQGKNNYLHQAGPSITLVAYRNKTPVARLVAGVDEELNHARGLKQGYIALYEALDDREAAVCILSEAEKFLRLQGMETVKGPLSLPGGDDYRGFIIDNFEDDTYVMNTYNKPYYNDHFLAFGMEKYMDCYAYTGVFNPEHLERFQRLVPYVKKRYGYEVHGLDLKNIQREMMDVKHIIDRGMPTDWEDFIPPGEKEVELIAKQLKPFADPDFIRIARTWEGEPIGFNIALPDYNQVLKRMHGRLFPWGFLTFLRHRKKIDRMRFFVLFVVPEYRKKGVTAAIYHDLLAKGLEKGYRYGEASTIWEYNRSMMNDVSGFTEEPYKTYRIYRKFLKERNADE